MKPIHSMKKVFASALALVMCLSAIPAASAAPVEEATIDMSKKGSITIYKYDLSSAERDGVWDSSYVSTGVYDASVIETLGGSKRHGDDDTVSDLGNGEKSTGYAIKGVEFSYLKVADIVQFSESAADSRSDSHVEVLYGVDKTKGADFLTAINLDHGINRYANADHLDANKYFYQSDVLIAALAAGLEANATTVKNALAKFISANGGTRMALTDSYGKTSASNLDLGLYLCVETKVPEQVVSTVNPFLISLPMTSVNGTNATDGGTRWMYDVTVMPKNLTGIPSLEKTLREQASDTGKNNGSTNSITDGYAHTGTASDGDLIDYQIISTLPSITSEATYLSCYTFIDTLSRGLTYQKNDVKLEFFTDPDCTDLITTWNEASGMFAVSYNTATNGDTAMTIEMTARGLGEINTSKAVYNAASMVNSGFSGCTVRITYQAAMDSDNSVVYGDAGNPNKVVLTWKRSSENFYDTLVDDAHLYVYGIDLTKVFSDGKGDYKNVEFIVKNKTDNYFVKAVLNKEKGIYYVTDHVAAEKDATHFVPVDSNGTPGKVIIRGLEDDEYIITETKTDNGYTLLRDSISVVISQKETTELCNIYSSDVLGLVQNDPRYASVIKDIGDLHTIPQKHLEHHLLTASSTVDGKAVTMLADGNSQNAEAPLSVVNTKGFDLPQTGDHGTWIYSVGGILMMAAAASVIFFVVRKKKTV